MGSEHRQHRLATADGTTLVNDAEEGLTKAALYFPGKQSYDCRVTSFLFNATYYYVFYGFIRRGPESRA